MPLIVTAGRTEVQCCPIPHSSAITPVQLTSFFSVKQSHSHSPTSQPMLRSLLSRGTLNDSLPIFSEVLSSSPHGVAISWWTGEGAGQWNPTQNPAVMDGVSNYTALAAHSDAKAYAMQDGVLKEFKVGIERTNLEFSRGCDYVMRCDLGNASSSLYSTPWNLS